MRVVIVSSVTVALVGRAGHVLVPGRGDRAVRVTPDRGMLDRIHQYGWPAAKLHYAFQFPHPALQLQASRMPPQPWSSRTLYLVSTRSR